MKKLSFILGALAMTAAMTTGCGSQGSKKDGKVATADSVKKVDVKVFTTQRQKVENVAEFTGNIEANVVNNIGPNQPLRINRIYVDVGATVAKGQLLVQMDPTSYSQAAVQLANVKQDYDRTKTVYEAGGVSRQTMDQLETQLNVLREQASNLRTNMELRSPIKGVVTGRYFDAGDLYSMTPNASGSACILTVMQIDVLKVITQVSEQYFPLVKKDMPVEIKVDLFPDQVFTGKVSLIYPSINPSTRTFTVEVSIPNPKQVLRPGMYCRTAIRLGEKDGVLVSDLAVQKQVGSSERYVYVIEQGKAVRRTVTIGRQIGDQYDVLTGLKEDEQVVTSGASRLSDGTPVNIIK